MSKLEQFLSLPDVDDVKKEVFVNDRLGTFTIKALTERQYALIMKRSSANNVIDSSKFNLELVSSGIVEPNFNDADFLSKVDCSSAKDFITKKFFPGEITSIASIVMSVSGFDIDINDKIEEAKN
jgi:hypothetical protein